jgi:hypothetical protein
VEVIGDCEASCAGGHESSTITEQSYVHLFDRQRTDEQVRQAMVSAR